jgi:hypothetical protein
MRAWRGRHAWGRRAVVYARPTRGCAGSTCPWCPAFSEALRDVSQDDHRLTNRAYTSAQPSGPACVRPAECTHAPGGCLAWGTPGARLPGGLRGRVDAVAVPPEQGEERWRGEHRGRGGRCGWSQPASSRRGCPAPRPRRRSWCSTPQGDRAGTFDAAPADWISAIEGSWRRWRALTKP